MDTYPEDSNRQSRPLAGTGTGTGLGQGNRVEQECEDVGTGVPGRHRTYRQDTVNTQGPAGTQTSPGRGKKSHMPLGHRRDMWQAHL